MSGFQTDAPALSRLADQLHAAGVELADLDPAHTEAGRVVVAHAAPPRSTGYLGAHLTAGVGASGITFASDARYWTFVHYGAPRRHIRARPFFPEAIHRTTDELVAVYAAHAHRTIDKIG